MRREESVAVRIVGGHHVCRDVRLEREQGQAHLRLEHGHRGRRVKFRVQHGG